MRTSGQSHEGWMALIPLSVLLFVVMVALGGPDAFVRTITTFAADVIMYGSRWLQSL